MPTVKRCNKLQRPQIQSRSEEEKSSQKSTGAACVYIYDTKEQPKEEGT